MLLQSTFMSPNSRCRGGTNAAQRGKALRRILTVRGYADAVKSLLDIPLDIPLERAFGSSIDL